MSIWMDSALSMFLSAFTNSWLVLRSKYSEFALWASEVMKMDIELLPKIEEKELFRTFCEDHNTATLPHQKYYSLQDYERKKSEGASKRGLSEVSPCMSLLQNPLNANAIHISPEGRRCQNYLCDSLSYSTLFFLASCLKTFSASLGNVHLHP